MTELPVVELELGVEPQTGFGSFPPPREAVDLTYLDSETDAEVVPLRFDGSYLDARDVGVSR